MRPTPVAEASILVLAIGALTGCPDGFSARPTDATAPPDSAEAGAVPQEASAGAVSVDPTRNLPFDPSDPNATFEARVRVENRNGEHPPASLSYGGTTYVSDADGLIVIPKVLVNNARGVRLVAPGYMPRPVLLTYGTAGAGRDLRVVLEAAATSRLVAADVGVTVQTGPAVVDLPPNSFKTADGKPYTGQVRVDAFAIDPTESVVTVTTNGLEMRKDFDPDRIPQGYLNATSQSGVSLDYIPESILHVELTTDTGAALSLAATAPATFRLKLSAFTQHKKGDIVPTFRFSEDQQRWIEAGTCLIQDSILGGGLECMGQTAGFSAWSLNANKDANAARRTCSRFLFRLDYDRTRYPDVVKTPIKKVTAATNPAVAQLNTAFTRYGTNDTGRNIVSELDKASAAVESFADWAGVETGIGLVRVDEKGAVVRDAYAYAFSGEAGQDRLPSTGRNLAMLSQSPALIPIARGTDFSACSPIELEIDLNGKVPYATEVLVQPETAIDAGADASSTSSTRSLPSNGCASRPAVADGVCVEPYGTIRCAKGKRYFSSPERCGDPGCAAGTVWNDDSASCVTVSACGTNNGGCDKNAQCVTRQDGTRGCTCRAGYHGDGLTCEANVTCAPNNPCKNGGSCVDGRDGYVCTCPGGYQGKSCEFDIDECATNNGGCDSRTTCTNTPGSRTCGPCPPGYKGTGAAGCTPDCATANGGCDALSTCRVVGNERECGPCPSGYSGKGDTACVDIDECSTNNGGCSADAICTNTPGGRNCTCKDTYAGDGGVCTRLEACPVNQCGVGGDCRVTGTDQFKCFCFEGYSGTLCETTPCDSAGGCLHGTCGKQPSGAFACNCEPGWTGATCDANPCLAAPCQNGGTCKASGSDYTCECAAGFSGPTCGTNIDDCTPNPCLNGGQCTDGTASYTCQCSADYTGTNCAVMVDRCSPNPCVHGSCWPVTGSYTCTCDPGWTGSNCSVSSDPCTPNPCQNGGFCLDMSGGSYECSCSPSWTGMHCETPFNGFNFAPKFPGSADNVDACFMRGYPDTGDANLPTAIEGLLAVEVAVPSPTPVQVATVTLHDVAAAPEIAIYDVQSREVISNGTATARYNQGPDTVVYVFATPPRLDPGKSYRIAFYPGEYAHSTSARRLWTAGSSASCSLPRVEATDAVTIGGAYASPLADSMTYPVDPASRLLHVTIASTPID